MVKENSSVGVQCRGCRGNLEKDVGVVVVIGDNGTVSVKCPFYDKSENCRPYSVGSEGKMMELKYSGGPCYLKAGKNLVGKLDEKR